MQLIRGLPSGHDTAHTAVAIGNFDGVHRGHQAVLSRMIQEARSRGLVPSVLTFSPHPRRFFQPKAQTLRLHTVKQKIQALRAMGVERCYILRFDARLAQMSPPHFMQEILHNRLHARHVVTGEDFCFGAGRTGNKDCLLQAPWFSYEAVPPVMIGDELSSSSRIRHALQAGDIAQANRLLGYDYCLSGSVVRGDGRGRTIGVPTANIALPADIALRKGVYAVLYHLPHTGRWEQAVANFGMRPTFGGEGMRFELHALTGTAPTYGDKVTVMPLQWLRDEQRFENADALIAQIRTDIEDATYFHQNVTQHDCHIC